MRIAIIGGTGAFGRALAERLSALGEDIVIGSRDPSRADEIAAVIGVEGAANEAAIARGLGRTGRIVTAAALLMAVVFFAIGTGRVSFITMFGLGLALAVLLDAFLIRVALVPAFMRLAGEWNWWAPGRRRPAAIRRASRRRRRRPFGRVP
jgi:uncharacterized membrane protein YdfJ with MMPL/SSD domain